MYPINITNKSYITFNTRATENETAGQAPSVDGRPAVPANRSANSFVTGDVLRTGLQQSVRPSQAP